MGLYKYTCMKSMKILYSMTTKSFNIITKGNNMYHENGLCGFLKGTDRIINKKASLCEDLKFANWQNEQLPKDVRLPKHKLIMARLKQSWWL